MALPGTACAEDALGSRLLSVLSAPSMYMTLGESLTTS